VLVSGLPASNFRDLAPDPPNESLMVAMAGPTGQATGVRFLIREQRTPGRLHEQATILNNRRITHINGRPGNYQGGRQYAIVEGQDCSLHFSHQPKTVVGLRSGTIRTAFSRDGKLLVYGKRTGEIGVLKLTDSGGRRSENSVSVEEAMPEKKVRGGSHANDWALAFDDSGALIQFVQTIDHGAGRYERLMGWLDVSTGYAYTLLPAVTESAHDWAFAVSTTTVKSDARGMVCYAGMSKHVYVAPCGKIEPRSVLTVSASDEENSPVIQGAHFDCSTLLVLHTSNDLWAIDPSRCTDSAPALVGKMPTDAPPVEQYHRIGSFNNADGSRTLFVIASAGVRKPRDESCGGRDGKDPRKP
jgi:hypothetical protein